jgi:hypothetical protein
MLRYRTFALCRIRGGCCTMGDPCRGIFGLSALATRRLSGRR